MHIGESLSINISFNPEYDKIRIQDLILHIGKFNVGSLSEGEIVVDDEQYRCAIKSEKTALFEAKKEAEITLTIDDSHSGIIKEIVGTIDVLRSNSNFKNDSVNTGTDIVITCNILDTVHTFSSEITAALMAVNLSDYYDKDEVDIMLSDKADNSQLENYYTKTESDQSLSLKADASDLENYYNKTESDQLINSKANLQGGNTFTGNQSTNGYWYDKLSKLTGCTFKTSQLVNITGTSFVSLFSPSNKFYTPIALTFPANSLSVNDIIRIKMKGVVSAAASQTATLEIKLGGVTLASILESFPNNIVNYYFEKEIEIGIRSNILCILQGRSLVKNGTSGQVSMFDLSNITPSATNIATDMLLEANFKWTSINASNSLKISFSYVEIL